MTSTPQIMYVEEFVPIYEQMETLTRQTVNTAAIVKGLTATWVVDGSGTGAVVTRGSNGKIAARAQSVSQKSATLVEWHDKPTITSFEEFASQGSIRQSMIRTQVVKLNKQIDTEILAILATATVTANTAASIATTGLFLRAAAKLAAGYVANDGKVFAAVTPAAWHYLMQATEFANSQLVPAQPFAPAGDMNQFKNRPAFRDWGGIKFYVHPQLSLFTASEKCYVYHSDAVGHAMNNNAPEVVVGKNEEEDYHFLRASMFTGATLLQNSGIVVVNHDGSALA